MEAETTQLVDASALTIGRSGLGGNARKARHTKTKLKTRQLLTHHSLNSLQIHDYSILFNHVNTVRIHTQELTDDQLEMVSGGVNETCRRVPVGNPPNECLILFATIQKLSSQSIDEVRKPPLWRGFLLPAALCDQHHNPP